MLEPDYLTAKFVRIGGTVQAELVITLDKPAPEVWAALTEADRLVHWLAPGEIELREGGAVQLDFGDSGVVIDSTLTTYEPRRRLGYSWSGAGQPQRPVDWTLEPIGPVTRVTLQLRIPADEDVARATAGWAAHLEILAAHLAGAAIGFPVASFRTARAAYAEQLATQGLTPVVSADAP